MATLAQLREHSGKTRARVAADLDMSERHLYRLESGESPIRVVVAHAFANYYGVDVGQIDGSEKAA